MEAFLLGLLGAVVGGLLLAGVVVGLALYEKKQSKKLANKLVDDIKNMYVESLNSKIQAVPKSKLN